MADMTVEEIDAQLVLLRAAKLQRMTGGTRTKVGYERTMVEKSVASLEEINGEIARLEVMRSGLTGEPSGRGPIRIGFGDRL